MLQTNDCIALFSRKIEKSVEEMTVEEKAILSDVVYDNNVGRYSKFLMWTTEERNEFMNWLNSLGEVYSNMSGPERWAYEDAFELPSICE